MRTQLDERQELINKIKLLSASDVHALKVFVAGMDIGKTLQIPMSNICGRESNYSVKPES